MDNNTLLKIENLHSEYSDPNNTENAIPILKGVNVEFEKGKVHAIMGPNGSGKSTLSSVIMGHPNYSITKGKISFNYKNRETIINNLPVDERARMGIFLSFQYPVAIPGLGIVQFLRKAINSINEKNIPIKEFRKNLNNTMQEIKMKPEFAKRYVNDGFSGGEKKRLEILQMKMLKPKLAILDEIDSGLDIDAMKDIAEGINSMRSEEMTLVIITHYKRLLKYVKPDIIHILHNGRIVKNGTIELADELEEKGYDKVIGETIPIG